MSLTQTLITTRRLELPAAPRRVNRQIGAWDELDAMAVVPRQA